MVTTKLEELCSLIQIEKESSIIGVEGFTGSGKSFLGKNLAERLNYEFLDLDSFIVIKDSGLPYRSILDYESLANAMKKEKIVVSGICLLEVLERIGMKPFIRIYVKEISDAGIWHEGVNLEEYFDKPEVLELREVHLSDAKYHMKYLPHTNSDFIFERAEQHA